MKNKARDFGHERTISFPTGAFSRSHSRQGSYDFGKIYPVHISECLPGEHIKVSNTMNLAFTETLSAIRHEVNAVIDWHFIPYGCIPRATTAEEAALTGMSNDEKLAYYDPRYGFRNHFWQDLITGGYGGQNVDTLQATQPNGADMTIGSLWDHMGFPMTIDPADYSVNKAQNAIFAAYCLVWNWNYRDENWQPAKNPINATRTIPGDPSESIEFFDRTLPPLLADWEKDYFTTALKSPQRGTAVAIDVEGVASAIYAAAVAGTAAGTITNDANNFAFPAGTPGTKAQATGGGTTAITLNAALAGAAAQMRQAGDVASTVNIPAANLNANTLNITSLGIDVAKLRTGIAMQLVLERNARAGVRESEWYRAHFKTGPNDDRGDKPYFIGRFKQAITFNDVTNVAVAGTPAGATPPTIATQTMGHRQSRGDASGAGYVGEYTAKEYGILMAVLIIRPRPMYYQKMEKQWFNARGRWDFPLPELAGLSEQGVLTRELAPATIATDGQIFGYQGRWDEYRQKVNDAVGLLRPTGAGGVNANLRSWNFGRNFSGVPVLGDTFLKVDPALIKAANFVYTTDAVPMMIGTIGNIVEVSNSPLPQIAQPSNMGMF